MEYAAPEYTIDCDTGMKYAIEYGNLKMVNFFIRCSNASLPMALVQATTHERINIIRLLIFVMQQSDDPDDVASYITLCLSIAIRRDKTQSFEYFLTHHYRVIDINNVIGNILSGEKVATFKTLLKYVTTQSDKNLLLNRIVRHPTSTESNVYFISRLLKIFKYDVDVLIDNLVYIIQQEPDSPFKYHIFHQIAEKIPHKRLRELSHVRVIYPKWREYLRLNVA